jgi:hypothetical protein
MIEVKLMNTETVRPIFAITSVRDYNAILDNVENIFQKTGGQESPDYSTRIYSMQLLIEESVKALKYSKGINFRDSSDFVNEAESFMEHLSNALLLYAVTMLNYCSVNNNLIPIEQLDPPVVVIEAAATSLPSSRAGFSDLLDKCDLVYENALPLFSEKTNMLMISKYFPSEAHQDKVTSDVHSNIENVLTSHREGLLQLDAYHFLFNNSLKTESKISLKIFPHDISWGMKKDGVKSKFSNYNPSDWGRRIEVNYSILPKSEFAFIWDQLAFRFSELSTLIEYSYKVDGENDYYKAKEKIFNQFGRPLRITNEERGVLYEWETEKERCELRDREDLPMFQMTVRLI